MKKLSKRDEALKKLEELPSFPGTILCTSIAPTSSQGKERREMMIKSDNEVDVYEINGQEQKTQVGSSHPRIHVKSHWNLDRMVIIQWHGDSGEEITVNASDLTAAIKNATNTNRHGY